MDALAQVIHKCETCAIVKQAKWNKTSLVQRMMTEIQIWGDLAGGLYQLPQICLDKWHALTIVRATTG